MLLAVLAAASILGDRPLSTVNPARQALIFQSLGQVVVRLDANGYVRARGCDGKLRHVGDLPAEPLRIHIANDGTLDGLVWDPDLSPEQRDAFVRMMKAVGYSDGPALRTACLPTPEAPELRNDNPGGARLQPADLGPLLGGPVRGARTPP